MKLRSIGSSLGAGVLASFLGACGALQQEPQCVVAKAVSDGSTGSFAANYTLKPGQDESAACARLRPEAVGLEKYFKKDPADPNEKETVSIRVAKVGALVKDASASPPKAVLDPSVPVQPVSVGVLTTEAPGADHFCQVPTLSPTRLVASTPALSLSYDWSNLRVYNTPEVPGTQFIADLRYTENGCTAEYTVRGIWPVVSCATSGKADPSKCEPYADLSVGRLRGSGINPSFPVMCHPVALICVLTGDVPSVP
jgi:hypothetical protein